MSESGEQNLYFVDTNTGKISKATERKYEHEIGDDYFLTLIVRKLEPSPELARRWKERWDKIFRAKERILGRKLSDEERETILKERAGLFSFN